MAFPVQYHSESGKGCPLNVSQVCDLLTEVESTPTYEIYVTIIAIK